MISLKHFISITGSVKLTLKRYLKDNRSIPAAGDSNGLDPIPDSVLFQVKDETVYLVDLDSGSYALGSHFQYLIDC